MALTWRSRDGERLACSGPSGSGKSTLLRAIAGLEPLAAGHIQWDGTDLAPTPVHARRFGLMFQDYALFPHLDVAAQRRVSAWRCVTCREPAPTSESPRCSRLVGMRGYERRLPAQLSGGEQQRVALARALAPRRDC